jgi:DNA-binding MarR family transcriptional regulator
MPANAKKPAERRTPGRADRFKDLAEELVTASDSRLVASELSTSFGFLLRLANGVSQEQLGKRLDALNLRTTLYSLMLIIHENPGLKQQEVGQTLSIQQPNLVALINELVERGLVSRTINAEDRRSYSLNLTSAGVKLLQQARRAHDANERKIAEAVHPLSPDQFREALVRVLGIANTTN